MRYSPYSSSYPSYSSYGPQVPYAPTNFAGSVPLITRSHNFPNLTSSSTIISCGSQPIFRQPTTSYAQPAYAQTVNYPQPTYSHTSYAQPGSFYVQQPAQSYAHTSYAQPAFVPQPAYVPQPAFAQPTQQHNYIMPSPYSTEGWRNTSYSIGSVSWVGDDGVFRSGVFNPFAQHESLPPTPHQKVRIKIPEQQHQLSYTSPPKEKKLDRVDEYDENETESKPNTVLSKTKELGLVETNKKQSEDRSLPEQYQLMEHNGSQRRFV